MGAGSEVVAIRNNRYEDIGQYDVMNNVLGGVGYSIAGEEGAQFLQATRHVVDGCLVLLSFTVGATAYRPNQSSGNSEGKGYSTFEAFKKENPVKTQGNQWHHIVEQSQQGKSGFSVQQINNTNNLIELSPSQHSQLSGFYSSKPDFTGGLTLRDWLAGQSFETQYKFGIDKLKEFGFMK